MPSGYLRREIADHAHNDVGFVLPIRAIHGHQPAVGIEIVLDKIARTEIPPACLPARG